MRPALGLASLLAVAVAACMPPRQAGEITVAPGAAERLAVAWRFGYAGVARPERPATTRVLADVSDLPRALGERARAGDVLLENGSVSFVIAAADGTARGGVLVDAWSEERSVDELGALRVVVAGRRVVARTVRGDVDEPTRAAWVDVVGTVETEQGPLEVTTRYDVAPGVDGVLVHTTFTRPTSPLEGVAVGDELEAPTGPPVALPGPPAALVRIGAEVAHAVVALDGPPAIVDAARALHGAPASALVGVEPGGLVLHSRLFLVVPGTAPITVASLQRHALGNPGPAPAARTVAPAP